MIAFNDIQAATHRIKSVINRTPLIPLPFEPQIYLKLENLQPIGSFKIRGAANAMLSADLKELSRGVFTASAGNMAQGVAWMARQLKIPCAVVVPEHAPETKLSALKDLNARIIKVPFEKWWNVLETEKYEEDLGMFIHPVSHPAVMAGNGTIGLEILEDLPPVNVIIVPFGGGGLSCGIASAVKSVRSQIQVIASEVQTAAPLAASLQAGKPVTITYTPSFVDGIGGKSVLPRMWPLIQRLLNGSIVVSPDEIRSAIRLLAQRCRVIAEGAGASSLAAALSNKAGDGKICCVISGGNINMQVLSDILLS